MSLPRSFLWSLGLAAALVFAGVAAPPRVVVAQDKPPATPDKPAAPPATPDKQADDVLAAFRSKDDAKLKAAAELTRPDPWIVADLLCARSEFDAAAALAKASPRKDLEKLPAYVASCKGTKDDVKSREALAAANAALGARRDADALALVEAAKPKGGDVVSILLGHAQGMALRGVTRLEESTAVFRTAGDAAVKAGWLARAAESYHESGNSAFKRGDVRVAAGAWQRRLEVEEQRGRPRGIADALGNMGAVCVRLDEYQRALGYMERSLKISEENGYKTSVAATLVNIGALYQRRGDFTKAAEFGERALKLAEESGDKTRIGQALSALATMRSNAGDWARATEMHQRALDIWEALGNRAARADDLGQLGHDRQRAGEYRGAIELHLRALAAHEELGDVAGQGDDLMAIGAAYLSLADYARALDHHERAAKLKEPGDDRRALARCLQNTGLIHDHLGDEAKALAFAQRALGIFEAIGDSRGVVEVFLNIGNIHHDQGDHAKALDFYERARRLSDEKGFPDRSTAASANIALIRRDTGDSAKSLEESLEALKRAEAAGDRDLEASVLGHVGATYHAMGDDVKALDYEQRALAKAEEIGNRELVVGTLENLALTQLARRAYRESAAYARRAVAETQILIQGVGDEQTTGARDKWDLALVAGTAAAGNLGDASEAVFFVESGRAGTLIASLRGRDALRAVAVPAPLREAEARARTAESAAVTELRRALDARKVADIAKARTGLDAAKEGLRDVVGRIQREAKGAAGLLYGQVDTLETLQGRLRDDEVMVLYSRFSWDRTAAVVVARAGARIVDLGPTKDLDAACAALTPGDAAVDATPAADALRKLAVDPLGIDGKVRRVLVSPDGSLSYAPFAMLLGDREVCYVPSGTTYGLLLAEREKHGEGVLALGDPDYGAKSAAPGAVATRGGMNLVRLPASGAEAKAVGDVALTGKDASESGLRGALAQRPRWRALHLACHGLVDPERPTLSSLALTPSGDDDGFLMALEVFQMHVPSDLVVLSACETGMGKVYKTEGIVGLTRAFMFAGAPRVVVSLWKVDDEATAALMKRFYEGWKKGLPAARSLREAQAFVRSQDRWRHPYYWAAWVLWGLPE